ncbi:hypothetical protein M406DRAFT_343886 [Cryphonectria parasitica EP155]|uniref:rRNA-processing protein EFG1 n=1 Tax=Cryphonectria parasitica (strain ATCC 38755 / EP155) TaxID=660469 RepID=A0A9P4YBI8_CRYP1|nr:uncharacterized protein M406DRAFT_343886 [Cryphonectria parasitica EP155]KAF3769857.1 hypothetical protein M406DRAFT_343886 [Cryphonectria parasitica EP155]
MGSKRSYAEVEASATTRGAAANKRKPFNHQHSRPRDYNSSSSNAPQNQSLNEIKKRARDIERWFARGGDMPSDVQRNLELELAHCKRQVEDLQHKKKRNEMISKYHKVRFFERQKAERLKKQLRKRLDKATDPQEKALLEEDFHKAEVDWYYTRYFPFMERYIGLYPAGKAKEDSGEDEPIAKRALHSERPPVWKEIEEAMGQGPRALERIQERRPEKPDAAAETEEQDSGEESDFFG